MDEQNEIIEIKRVVDNIYRAVRITSSREKFVHKFCGVSITTNEVHTLEVISNNDGLSQKKLNQLMLRTKGAVSAVVDKLQEKGLVTKNNDPVDARIHRIYITKLGAKVNDAHIQYDIDVIKKWIKKGDVSMADCEATNRVTEIFCRLYEGNSKS